MWEIEEYLDLFKEYQEKEKEAESGKQGGMSQKNIMDNAGKMMKSSQSAIKMPKMSDISSLGNMPKMPNFKL